MVACVSLASLLALSGCSAVQVKLGLRVSLAKVPVVSMEASLPNNPAIAPGEKSPLVVEVTGTDGKVLVTEGKGKGKILWKDLSVTASVVSVNNKGVLSLPKDPRVSDGKTGYVDLTIPSHPGIHAELDIPLHYDYNFAANFSGAPGFPGSNGIDGADGASGLPGSIDPNNPSPGGKGSNGGNGTDGSDGGNGGDAQPVQVMVTLRPGTHPLLQVSVSSTGSRKVKFFLVDPQGGSLTVNATGGAGGSGGKGGRAGRGGSGGIGSPNGSNGGDGSAGRDGGDGQPGRGGSITVTYDPQAKPYLGAIHLNNDGGPTPVFQEQPVAPLW
jgi:hypothetical protein